MSGPTWGHPGKPLPGRLAPPVLWPERPGPPRLPLVLESWWSWGPSIQRESGGARLFTRGVGGTATPRHHLGTVTCPRTGNQEMEEGVGVEGRV